MTAQEGDVLADLTCPKCGHSDIRSEPPTTPTARYVFRATYRGERVRVIQALPAAQWAIEYEGVPVSVSTQSLSDFRSERVAPDPDEPVRVVDEQTRLDDAVRLVEDVIDATSEHADVFRTGRTYIVSARTGSAIVQALIEAGWTPPALSVSA